MCGGYDRAHDAVQEGFARALGAKERFSGGSLDQPLGDDLPDVAPVMAARDSELNRAIRTLPPKRRLIVFLRYFADLAYTEIAEVTTTAGRYGEISVILTDTAAGEQVCMTISGSKGVSGGGRCTRTDQGASGLMGRMQHSASRDPIVLAGDRPRRHRHRRSRWSGQSR